jgi:hypothetical protein
MLIDAALAGWLGCQADAGVSQHTLASRACNLCAAASAANVSGTPIVEPARLDQLGLGPKPQEARSAQNLQILSIQVNPRSRDTALTVVHSRHSS